MPADDLTGRFPELADLDDADMTQRIKAFQTVLDELRHELDDDR